MLEFLKKMIFGRPFEIGDIIQLDIFKEKWERQPTKFKVVLLGEKAYKLQDIDSDFSITMKFRNEWIYRKVDS